MVSENSLTFQIIIQAGGTQMDRRFAISKYHDAAAITKQLDELIKKPIYTIKPDALERYEQEYYGKKCKKSKAIIDQAMDYIPGGFNIILPSTIRFRWYLPKPKALTSMI